MYGGDNNGSHMHAIMGRTTLAPMVCSVSSKLGDVGSMLTFRIDCGASKQEVI